MFQVKWCAPLVIAAWVTQRGRVSQSHGSHPGHWIYLRKGKNVPHVVAHISIPSTWEAETDSFSVGGQPGIYGEFQDSLRYIVRPYK